MFIPNIIKMTSVNQKQAAGPVRDDLESIRQTIERTYNISTLIIMLGELADFIDQGNKTPTLVKAYQLGLLKLADLYRAASPQRAEVILEAYLGKRNDGFPEDLRIILGHVQSIRGNFISPTTDINGAPFGSPEAVLVGIYESLARGANGAILNNNEARQLLRLADWLLRSATDAHLSQEIANAQWREGNNYVRTALSFYAENALRPADERLNVEGVPCEPQTLIDNSTRLQVYLPRAEYQTIMARAQFQQGDISQSCTSFGQVLNISNNAFPSLNQAQGENGGIAREYFWCLIRQAQESKDAAALLNLAKHIHDQGLFRIHAEYRKMLGAILGQVWKILFEAATSKHSRLTDNRETLNLIFQYFSDEAIGFSYVGDDGDTYTDEKMVHTALWTLINCYADYAAAETYALKHRFNDILISALQNMVGQDRRPETLRNRVTLAVLYKYILDGIPTSGSVWENLARIASSQLDINGLSELPRNSGDITLSHSSLDLFYELDTIARILDNLSPDARPQGLAAEQIYALAEEELSRAEADLLRAISRQASLKNFMNLAGVYLRMAEYKKEDDDFVHMCLARAQAIFSGIIAATGHATSIDSPDPVYFNALHNLQDINAVIRRLSLIHFNLDDNERGEVYLEFADATRRLMLNSDLDLEIGRSLYREIKRLYNEVFDLIGSNADQQRRRAQDGIRLATQGFAEILIQNGESEEAIGLIKDLISGINLRPAGDKEGRAEDLKFYLLCLMDLAWAYEKWAEKSGETPGNREQTRDLYLLSAEVYRFLSGAEAVNGAEAGDELNIILQNAQAIRAELVEEERLAEVDLTPIDLQLKYLNYIRQAAAAGPLAELDLLRNVIAALAALEGAEVIHSQALTALHQRLAIAGMTGEAAAVIEEAVTQARQAFDNRPDIDSFSALTWALGVRGGFLMAQGLTEPAQSSFDAAIALYRQALDKEPGWYLDLAKLLRARYQDDPNNFDEVLQAFEDAVGSGSDQKLALVEQAEALIYLGKLEENAGQGALAKGHYEQAIEQCRSVLGTAGGTALSIEAGVLDLRARNTLGWALNSLAALVEDPECHRAALEIYGQLIASPPHEDILFAAQITLWQLKLSYLGTLYALKDSQETLNVGQGYLEEVGESQNLDEARFLINVLIIIGNVYLWNLKDHEQAEKYYKQAEELITATFDGNLDRDMRAALRQIHAGRARILYEQEQWQDALDMQLQITASISDNPQGDELQAAINANLEIANIYNYGLDDFTAALPYYNYLLAQTAGRNLEIYTSTLLGLANGYLREDNRIEAHRLFDEITTLIGEDNPSTELRLTLVRALLGIARLNAEAGQIELGQEELEDARILLAGITSQNNAEEIADLSRQIRDAGYFWDERRDQAVAIGFNAGHSESEFRGNPSEGENYELTLRAPLTDELEYSASLGVNTISRGYGERYDSIGQTLPRLESDLSLSFLNSFLYKLEKNDYNLRFNLGLDLNLFDFRVHSYTFNDYFNSYQDSPADQIYANAVIEAGGGFDYKWQPSFWPESTFMLGIDGDVGLLAGFNENPATAANRAASTEDEFLYRWTIQPMARWIMPFDSATLSIGAGAVIGNDQISTSNQGFWTLGDVDTEKYAFKGSLSLTLALGDEDRWQIPLEFNAEYGNYTYLQGSLGVGYNFDEALLEFLLWGSYFNREGASPNDPTQIFEGDNHIETWDLNLGTTVHF